jgi:hypothetical protein
VPLKAERGLCQEPFKPGALLVVGGTTHQVERKVLQWDKYMKLRLFLGVALGNHQCLIFLAKFIQLV